MAKLILTEYERASPLLARLVDHWREELDILRKKNDFDADALKTANLRGKIEMLKANIALADPPRSA